MSTSSPNGAFRWIAGALLSVLLVGMAAFIASVDSRLERVENRVDRIWERVVLDGAIKGN